MNVIDAAFGLGTVRLAVLGFRRRLSPLVFAVARVGASPARRWELAHLEELRRRQFARISDALRWGTARAEQSGEVPSSFFARLRAPSLPPTREVWTMCSRQAVAERAVASTRRH